MFIKKIIKNNTIYSVQELHLRLFSFPVEVILTNFTSLTASVHSSTSLSTNFFYICSFRNLNIHQHHMIYHIHIHNYQDSKHILYRIHLYQSILYIRIDIYHHFNVVYYYKRLHLIYIYTYTFHAILFVLFHQFLTLD